MSAPWSAHWITPASRSSNTRGDGLGGSSFNYGFSKTSKLDLIKAVVYGAKVAKIAVLMLPGLGTIHDLNQAYDAGKSVARIATRCT